MSKDAKVCRLSGCERPAKTRGLCGACYLYMLKGTDTVRRQQILGAALPAKPNRRARSAEDADDLSVVLRAEDKRLEPTAAQDLAVRTVHAAMEHLGVERARVEGDGIMYRHGDRRLLVTPLGTLRPVAYSVGEGLAV